jgi:hypothetical protein
LPRDIASLFRYTPAPDIPLVLLRWGRERVMRELQEEWVHKSAWWFGGDLSRAVKQDLLQALCAVCLTRWRGSDADKRELAQWFLAACLQNDGRLARALPRFRRALALEMKPIVGPCPMWARLVETGSYMCECQPGRVCACVHSDPHLQGVVDGYLTCVDLVRARPFSCNAHLSPCFQSMMLQCLANEAVGAFTALETLLALMGSLDFVAISSGSAITDMLDRCRDDLRDAVGRGCRGTIDGLTMLFTLQWVQPGFPQDASRAFAGSLTLVEESTVWQVLVVAVQERVLQPVGVPYASVDINRWGPRIALGQALRHDPGRSWNYLQRFMRVAAEHCVPLSADWLVALICLACSVAPSWLNRVFERHPASGDDHVWKALGESADTAQSRLRDLRQCIGQWMQDLLALHRTGARIAQWQFVVVLRSLQAFLEWWCVPRWLPYAKDLDLATFVAVDGPLVAFVKRALGRPFAARTVHAVTALGAKMLHVDGAAATDDVRAVFAPAAASVLAHLEQEVRAHGWRPLHSVHMGQLWAAMVTSDAADLTPFLALACRYVWAREAAKPYGPHGAHQDCQRVMSVWTDMAAYASDRAAEVWTHSFFGTLLNLEHLWYTGLRNLLAGVRTLPGSLVDALVLVMETAHYLAPHRLDPDAGPLAALVVPRGWLDQCSSEALDIVVGYDAELASPAREVLAGRDQRWSPLREAWCVQVARAVRARMMRAGGPVSQARQRRRVEAV